MVYQSSSYPFEDIRAPSRSGSESSLGTPRSSTSSSLASSPFQMGATTPLPDPDATQPLDETPKPSVTPSLLDSPLSRKSSVLPLPGSSHEFVQHSRYYFEDKMAVFLVEGCLFRVHRYHLDRESQVFPKGIGSKHDPIVLPDTTREEFESLLDFFYDGMHNETIPSLAAWSSLLAISTRFDMERIRSRAIAEILSFRPRIDPVELVVLAVKHGVPDWLPIAYAALCQREDAIEVEEAIKLGLETTVLLAKARERVRKANTKPFWNKVSRIPPPQHELRPSVPDPAPFDASVVDRILEEIFWPAPENLPEPGPLDNSEAAREHNESGDPVLQSLQPTPEFRIWHPVVQPVMMEKISEDPLDVPVEDDWGLPVKKAKKKGKKQSTSAEFSWE